MNQRFRLAQRHSNFVKFAKYSIPILSFFAIFVLSMSYLTDESAKPILKEVSAAELGDTEIAMQRPAINGISDQGITYKFNAQSAVQADANSQEVFLNHMIGTFNEAEDQSQLFATEAIYIKNKQILNILSAGRYSTEDGRLATFPQAVINAKEQTVEIDQGIFYQSPTTSLRAQKARLNDKTREYFFEGRVQTQLQKGAR